ncbi:hypothetical protein ACJJIL_13995 [Microbulbifer sp. EKSA005]|uniref:hypothetical protein n=1 Tax=Microbulbifer sp. EKSA005 TaxID=3243364 RepID=UPI004041ADE9
MLKLKNTGTVITAAMHSNLLSLTALILYKLGSQPQSSKVKKQSISSYRLNPITKTWIGSNWEATLTHIDNVNHIQHHGRTNSLCAIQYFTGNTFGNFGISILDKILVSMAGTLYFFSAIVGIVIASSLGSTGLKRAADEKNHREEPLRQVPPPRRKDIDTEEATTS